MNKYFAESFYNFLNEFLEILVKVTNPDYENELGNKYFLRQWSKL